MPSKHLHDTFGCSLWNWVRAKDWVDPNRWAQLRSYEQLRIHSVTFGLTCGATMSHLSTDGIRRCDTIRRSPGPALLEFGLKQPFAVCPVSPDIIPANIIGRWLFHSFLLYLLFSTFDSLESTSGQQVFCSVQSVESGIPV